MEIVLKRGQVIKFEDLKPYTIALDGVVQGPKVDAKNHRYSFDHHDSCLRFCTNSACMGLTCMGLTCMGLTCLGLTCLRLTCLGLTCMVKK